MTTREDIEFISGSGATLRGWFYPASEQAPCVVLQHGFTGTRDMHLDAYSEVFQSAGLSCLAYDHPGFGTSDAVPGTPRQEVDPWQQIRAIQDAITYVQSRPDVDADRIGLWGTSYGAANAYITAAIDRRVKAVVGQLPLISGSRNFQALVRIDYWAQMETMFAADRQGRMAGNDPVVIPVVHPDPLAPSGIPTADAHEFFTRIQAETTTTWKNEVTLRSMELLRSHEAGIYLPLISPTPLLMIVAPMDRLAAGEWATAAYETAAQPKKLVLTAGGHFDPYEGEGFKHTSDAAADWFTEHLMTIARKPV
ncbi:MAG: alpha/beta fold hydrolase [Actinobacteria bacterium]|nr:alpha/beta fold hydrolase [Actinomycetota bacterium]